jgi:hypothetical protein
MIPIFYVTIFVSDELVLRSMEDFDVNFGFIGLLRVKI